MIVDGKAIALQMTEDLGAFVRAQGIAPSLAVLTCNPDFATKQFLAIKQRVAREIGVTVAMYECAHTVTVEEVLRTLTNAVEMHDGVIVQLPFPPHVPISELLDRLPKSHDVDVIGSEADRAFKGGDMRVLPPVVSAIARIARQYKVSLPGTHAVVVGSGRLVGAPTAVWLTAQDASVHVLTKESPDTTLLKDADVVVLGAGVPHFITKDMLKEGVVVFDAGTSEDGGKVVGDADPSCKDIASLITPVPGGIGPITVRALFENLLMLRYGYEPDVDV